MLPFFRKLYLLLSFSKRKRRKNASGKYGDSHLRPYTPRVDWTRLLPDLILRKIFLDVVVLSTHPSSPFIQPHPSCAPLTLSQVCSRWLRVALYSPTLWSSIYVRNTLSPDLLRVWLERSRKGTALDFRIHGEHRIGEVAAATSDDPLHQRMEMKTKPSLVGQAWDLVVREIHRWRRVELILDRHAASRVLELPWWNATALKHLSIQVNFRGDQPGVQILDSLLQHKTSLFSRRFKLCWESMSLPTLVYHPIWAHLRNIHLTMGLTMDECIRFLKQCTDAEEVTLGCITNDWIGDMDNEHERQLDAMERERYSQPVRGGVAVSRHMLSKLRRLSLGLDGSACDCTLILQFFTLPSLRVLRFQNFGSNIKSCKNLEGLLLRSPGSTGLQELAIIDHYMNQPILPSFLCMRNPDGKIIPAVSIYTRRGMRLEDLGKALEIDADPVVMGCLDYYQDASGGTSIGRGGLPDNYLLI